MSIGATGYIPRVDLEPLSYTYARHVSQLPRYAGKLIAVERVVDLKTNSYGVWIVTPDNVARYLSTQDTIIARNGIILRGYVEDTLPPRHTLTAEESARALID